MKAKFISMLYGAAVLLTSCSNEIQSQIAENNVITNSKSSPSVASNSKVSPSVTINAGSTQQYIRGFGGANIRGWIPDLTSDQRIKAFSITEGLGLSVLRVRIPHNSSNWAAEKPTIDVAKSYGASVIASAWTAPASMKDNNNLISGKLKPSSFAAYAQHLRDYNTAVGGVTAISPANEPNITVTYESMKMTALEVADFVAAEGSNCGTKIMAPEPYNMDATYINSFLSNATANTKTSYISGHIYGVTPSSNNFGKEVWMTEHITDTNDANDWTGAMNTAKEIHNCMNVGYSMYTWWYIRRSYGLIDENSNITKRGYAMSHFSRWIRPGFNKISCTSNPTSGVFITAYKNGSKLVVVTINTNTEVVYQPFSYNGITVTGFNRYKTTSTTNSVADAFSVSGGSFAINLPASSITTLVSQ